MCSTFTRGAKPATRRVADGERMNPQGKGGAFAPRQGDDEHQGDGWPPESPSRDRSMSAFSAANDWAVRDIDAARSGPELETRRKYA